MRISIKPYLIDYVTEMGSQLGIEDSSEIVSVILLDHKRGLCSCSRTAVQEPFTTTSPPPIQPKDPNELLADGLEDLLNSASY